MESDHPDEAAAIARARAILGDIPCCELCGARIVYIHQLACGQHWHQFCSTTCLTRGRVRLRTLRD